MWILIIILLVLIALLSTAVYIVQHKHEDSSSSSAVSRKSTPIKATSINEDSILQEASRKLAEMKRSRRKLTAEEERLVTQILKLAFELKKQHSSPTQESRATQDQKLQQQHQSIQQQHQPQIAQRRPSQSAPQPAQSTLRRPLSDKERIALAQKQREAMRRQALQRQAMQQQDFQRQALQRQGQQQRQVPQSPIQQQSISTLNRPLSDKERIALAQKQREAMRRQALQKQAAEQRRQREQAEQARISEQKRQAEAQRQREAQQRLEAQRKAFEMLRREAEAQSPYPIDRQDFFEHLQWLDSNTSNELYKQYRSFKSDHQAMLNYLQKHNIKYLYHFTAEENLSSIVKNGGLFSWWFCEHNGIKIPKAGGDSLSHRLDVKHKLQDYVRLSFCDDHPMQYRLKKQGIDLVLLKIDIKAALLESTLFSDINATANQVQIGDDLDFLRNKVNLDATQEHYVRRDSPIFKQHQAEILVKNFVPLQFIQMPY